jgi:hypothetical protein
MVQEGSTPGWKFYNRQMDFIYKKDVDNLIDTNYNDDAQLLSLATDTGFTVKGKEALKEHFKGYLQMLGDLTVKSVDKWQETDDTIFFEASVNASNIGDARVYDAFILRNGKVSHHLSGLK